MTVPVLVKLQAFTFNVYYEFVADSLTESVLGRWISCQWISDRWVGWSEGKWSVVGWSVGLIKPYFVATLEWYFDMKSFDLDFYQIKAKKDWNLNIKKGSGRNDYKILQKSNYPHFLPTTKICFCYTTGFIHGTIIRTGITCKKIPCYMRDSACRWLIVEHEKYFEVIKTFLNFPTWKKL